MFAHKNFSTFKSKGTSISIKHGRYSATVAWNHYLSTPVYINLLAFTYTEKNIVKPVCCLNKHYAVISSETIEKVKQTTKK